MQSILGYCRANGQQFAGKILTLKN